MNIEIKVNGRAIELNNATEPGNELVKVDGETAFDMKDVFIDMIWRISKLEHDLSIERDED